eukprot:Selendium_serpulae@DN1767_c0_g1_i1.p1
MIDGCLLQIHKRICLQVVLLLFVLQFWKFGAAFRPARLRPLLCHTRRLSIQPPATRGANAKLMKTEVLRASEELLPPMNDVKLPPKLWLLIRAFQLIQDTNESIELMSLFGQEIGAFPQELQTEEHQSSACLSDAYIAATPYIDHENVLRFKVQGKGDADLVKGFVNFLVVGLTGASADSVSHITTDLGSRAGFSAGYKANRALGFSDLIAIVKNKVHKTIKEPKFANCKLSSAKQDGYDSWELPTPFHKFLRRNIFRLKMFRGDYHVPPVGEDPSFIPIEGTENVNLFPAENYDDEWMDED